MNPATALAIKQQTGLIWQMRSGAQFARSYFDYHVSFAAIASGANATSSVTIQSDSHFLLHSLVFVCFDNTTNGNIAIPDTSIQITDTGSGTNLFDGPVRITNVAGTAQLPALLLPPRLFAPASTVSVQLTNNVSTNAQRYEVVFVGEKIFDFAGS